MEWLAKLGLMPAAATENAAQCLPLQQACRDRRFILVTAAGDDVSYQSMVLSVEAKQQQLTIDRLFPDEISLSPGQTLQVTVLKGDGSSLRFESQVLAALDDEYRISFPQWLQQEQRRQAYRLPLRNHPVEARYTAGDALSLDASATAKAQLMDVSVCGAALSLPIAEADRLEAAGAIEGLRFDFAGAELHCDFTICNIQREFDDQHALVGGEFAAIDGAQRRALERGISKMQRQQLRLM
jgi:c-di-GMP-binding flagellar brake protein YcgR